MVELQSSKVCIGKNHVYEMFLISGGSVVVTQPVPFMFLISGGSVVVTQPVPFRTSKANQTT